MAFEVAAVVILAATCAALSYFSFRRLHDALLAGTLGLLVFFAFLFGSLLHPVELTAKRTSHELSIAQGVGAAGQSLVPLDQEALENLPNITLPAQGNIDFVAVRTETASLRPALPTFIPARRSSCAGGLPTPSRIILALQSSSSTTPRIESTYPPVTGSSGPTLPPIIRTQTSPRRASS